MEPWHPQPWMLPLIVVALVVPAFVGFAVGGTPLGTAVGALTFATLIVLAARSRPREPIVVSGTAAGSPLVAMALAPIEGAEVANRIAVLAEADRGDRPHGDYEVLVLAPHAPTTAQRWMSDDGPGRVAAQERLAVSIATLATAGVHAEGRVVDESVLLAIEDIAAQHDLSRVVFITPEGAEPEVVTEIRDRLDRPVDRIEVEVGDRPG